MASCRTERFNFALDSRSTAEGSSRVSRADRRTKLPRRVPYGASTKRLARQYREYGKCPWIVADVEHKAHLSSRTTAHIGGSTSSRKARVHRSRVQRRLAVIFSIDYRNTTTMRGYPGSVTIHRSRCLSWLDSRCRCRLRRYRPVAEVGTLLVSFLDRRRWKRWKFEHLDADLLMKIEFRRLQFSILAYFPEDVTAQPCAYVDNSNDKRNIGNVSAVVSARTH